MAKLFSDKFIYRIPANKPPRDWHNACLHKWREVWGSHSEGQFTFNLGASVGAGKTYMAALVAQELLNSRQIDRVAYVCPNKIITDGVIRTFRTFDIFLSDWDNAQHAGEGEGAATQGAVLTYQSLAQSRCWKSQRRIADRKRTLAIFDEIHHLGGRLAWAQAARQAFEDESVAVMGMSGTWFRSDNKVIPFGTYLDYDPDEADVPFADQLRYLYCHYTYTLGEGVADGVNKQPAFVWPEGKVCITVNGVSQDYSIDRPPPKELENSYINAAVASGSASRLDALRIVLERCKAEGRKLIIFVGGYSRSHSVRAVDDASRILPSELHALGVSPSRILSITGETENSLALLANFGKSDADILIAVNMVSEGVDIPELSAALFLTSVTATATTIQRIGRTLRTGPALPATALIFMFWHPAYVSLAERIEKKIKYELQRREANTRAAASRSGAPRIVHAVGVSACEGGMTIGGKWFAREQVALARQRIAEQNFPRTETYLAVALHFLFGRNGGAA